HPQASINTRISLPRWGRVRVGDAPAIGAPKEYFPRQGFDPSPIKDVDQRDTAPLGGADSTEGPLLALDRRIEHRAAVAGTLQGDDMRFGTQRLQVLQARAQGIVYQATYLQLSGGRRVRADLKVLT